MKKLMFIMWIGCIVGCTGYKESYIEYAKALSTLPHHPTIQVTLDRQTGNSIVTYTDPRDRVMLKPPEHSPLYTTIASVIEGTTKIFAIIEGGKVISNIANRPVSTDKEVYVDIQWCWLLMLSKKMKKNRKRLKIF
ncbi:MAG: hypothetical protein HQK77_20515 [Desulfobacterales bacterium]|nr:hypothetical protein [Desulfobacterales bacterium]